MSSKNHRPFFLTLLVVIQGTLAAMGEQSTPQLTETPKQTEERLAWFRDAKFGLFIHWGPAALSGEEISWGMAGRIEGGAQHMKVPRETYMNLYKDFNPVKFQPDELVSLAKNAGMKYLVFVTKHHDGFSLWPTKEKRFPENADYPVHYSIADTPYKKDPLRMVQQAAKKQGLKLGWYYSTRDWTHPAYLQGDNMAYNNYYENQVEELLREYGPVDMLWFDHCFEKWSQYTIPRLYEKMYAHNPKLLVNDRAAKGLTDIPAEFAPLRQGDFDTPENRMGAFQHGRAWESCMILSPHEDHGGWSYRPDAKTRSLTETIRLLSSCVCGDGNMLLNLAPLPDGSIRPEEKAILEGIAPWIRKNGEAIYATRGGPWINGPWGGSTYRGKQVYLHLIDPTDEPYIFNRLPQNILAATTIDGQEIPFSQNSKKGTISLTLPKSARDSHVSIIKLTLDKEVQEVLYGPALANQQANDIPGTLTFHPRNAEHKGDLQVTSSGESSVLTHWNNPKDTANWPLEIDSPGTYTVQLTTSATEAGSTLSVVLGKTTTLHTLVPRTGGEHNYQSYQIGKVTFPNAESIQLLLCPNDHGNWKPIQVKEIKLIPYNSSHD